MSFGILQSFTRDCATAFLARIPSWLANLDPGPIKSILLNVYRFSLLTIGLIIAFIRLALNVATFELYEHYYLGRTDFIVQFLWLYQSYITYDLNVTEYGPNPVTKVSLEVLSLHFILTAAYVVIMLLVMLISPQRLVSWPAFRADTDDIPCSFVDEALLAGTRSPRASLISCKVVSNAVNVVINSPTVRAMIPLCLDPWLCGFIRAMFLGTYRAVKCAILRTPGFSVSYITMYLAGVALHLMYHALCLFQDLIFIRADRISFGKEDDLDTVESLGFDENLEPMPFNDNMRYNVRTQATSVPAVIEIVDERNLVDTNARVTNASASCKVGNHTD